MPRTTICLPTVGPAVCTARPHRPEDPRLRKPLRSHNGVPISNLQPYDVAAFTHEDVALIRGDEERVRRCRQQPPLAEPCSGLLDSILKPGPSTPIFTILPGLSSYRPGYFAAKTLDASVTVFRSMLNPET